MDTTLWNFLQGQTAEAASQKMQTTGEGRSKAIQGRRTQDT